MSLTQKDFRPNTKLFRSARNPQAPPPFLSILPALFVPLLGDETTKFTWCGDGEGGRKWMSLLETRALFDRSKFQRGDVEPKKNLPGGPASKNTSVFLSPPFTTALGGGKEEEEEKGRDSEAALSLRRERREKEEAD